MTQNKQLAKQLLNNSWQLIDFKEVRKMTQFSTVHTTASYRAIIRIPKRYCMGWCPVFWEPIGARGTHWVHSVVAVNKEAVLCWCVDNLSACLSHTSARTKNTHSICHFDRNLVICDILGVRFDTNQSLCRVEINKYMNKRVCVWYFWWFKQDC